MATPPDFVAGSVLTAAQMNAIGAWEIASASATSGSTLAVNNCFTTDYDAYMIVLSNVKTSSGHAVTMTLGSTTTGYYYSGMYIAYTATTYNGDVGANVAFWQAGTVGRTANSSGGTIFIQNPFLTERTTYQAVGSDPDTSGSPRWYNGFLNNTTSYTSITFSAGANTFSSITARVYGLRK